MKKDDVDSEIANVYAFNISERFPVAQLLDLLCFRDDG